MSIALPILLSSISKITELLSDARDVGSAWNLFTVANSSTQFKKPTMFSLSLKVLKKVAIFTNDVTAIVTLTARGYSFREKDNRGQAAAARQLTTARAVICSFLDNGPLEPE